jgi:hypothetical protein
MMQSPVKSSSSTPPAYDTQPIDQGRNTMSVVTVTTLLNPSSLFNAQNLALLGLVAGAVLILISAIALVRVTDVKRELANKSVAEANERSDRAKAEASAANERVAMMLQQLRKAVEMKSAKPSMPGQGQAMPDGKDSRRVSADEHDKIVNAMKGYHLAVTILTVNDDKEASQFAADLAKTLRDAGLTVSTSTSLFATPFEGLGMSMTSSEAGMRLYTALHGVGYTLQDLPKRDPIMLYVGRKPHAR